MYIGALWLRSSCVERATWNYWVPSSEPFNWYYFVVSWTWTQALPELSLFCTYWSDILRKGDAYACFVTNWLYCRVVVKRTWRWITRNGFFTIISNRKFRGISLVRTWAILPKTFPVTIVFLWSWHLRCVTQETLPLLPAHRSIRILLQIPHMINIISSRSIIYRIWKDWRSIGIKFNGNRLLSSTNWSSKIELIWSRAHILRYFGVDVAVVFMSCLDMVLWPFWQLWSDLILSRSWSDSTSSIGNSGVDCLHSTSWVISAFHFSMTATSIEGFFGEQSWSWLISMVWCLVAIKDWMVSIWNISSLCSISDNSTFWSDMCNSIILVRRPWSLSISSLILILCVSFSVSVLLNNFLIEHFDIVRTFVVEWYYRC